MVLGATGTIGGAITRDLLAGGAKVVGTGRSPKRLSELGAAGASVLPLALTGSTASSNALRDACGAALGGGIDGLVICTGAHGPIGRTRDVNADELAEYTATHLVGPVAAISSLAPLLDSGTRPSVVVMSGGGATGPRPRYSAYAMSKVALVRLVENLAIEEPGWGVNGVAPGFIASAIHESSIEAGHEQSGEDPDALRARLDQPDDLDRVVGLVSALISPDGLDVTGRLISAQWDPWEDPTWTSHLGSSPDLGRLRRIDDQQFGALPDAK